MYRYDFVITAVCPKEQREAWREAAKNGLVLTELGSSVRLEGFRKTDEDFYKLQHLIADFPEHHVHVKLAKEAYHYEGKEKAAREQDND